MTSTTKTDELLRMDERGRVRVSAARRAELLAEYERSGLSGAAFARCVGMKYPTLANWLQQRRKAGAAATGAAAPAPRANQRGNRKGQGGGQGSFAPPNGLLGRRLRKWRERR